MAFHIDLYMNYNSNLDEWLSHKDFKFKNNLRPAQTSTLNAPPPSKILWVGPGGFDVHSGLPCSKKSQKFMYFWWIIIDYVNI